MSQSLSAGRMAGASPSPVQLWVEEPQWSLVGIKIRRVQDLNTGIVFAIKGRHRGWTTVVLRVLVRVEPKTQMVSLYRVGRRVCRCIREWRIVEDCRCRRGALGKDEGLDIETSPEMFYGLALMIRLNVSLIPR